jgi:transposase
MLEMSTSGAGVSGEAAGPGDRGAVGGLGSGASVRGPAGVPDPELVEQAKRRSFTAKYKLEILERADSCSGPGEVGELLRREGLYSSHLANWRKQRREGALAGLGASRGRKPTDRRDVEIAELKRRNERLEGELGKARRVIEIQGNLSALLEQMLGTEGESGSTEP